MNKKKEISFNMKQKLFESRIASDLSQTDLSLRRRESVTRQIAFEIALTNLGLYTEGTLAFQWVPLPAQADVIKEALTQIGIGAVYEEYFITDYDGDTPIIYRSFGEYENLENLNYLAHLIIAEPDQKKLCQRRLKIDP